MGSILRLDQIQFQKQMSEFIGKQISIVFTDRTVSFGSLTKISGNTITLCNMRLTNTHYLITNIDEVYLDKKQ
jgi:hypothetical protein